MAKDALGHGSNNRGGAAKGDLVYSRNSLRPMSVLSDKAKRLAGQADDTAMRVMGKIDNGIHSQTINDLPQMQRRHYENIAAELKAQGASAKSSVDHGSRVRQYADRLATTNPLFNRQRFISAATP
jgi:hypothetical protein